jgi:PKD repeat protein
LTRYRSLAALVSIAVAAGIFAARAPLAAAQSSGGLNPVLTVTPSTTAVNEPVLVSYTVPPSSGASSASGLTTTSLDFGDGQTADGGSVGPGETVVGTAAHTYTDPGTYTITLSAQAPDGETGAASATVTIAAQLQPPAVQIQGPTASVQPGEPVSFTYSVTPAAGAQAASITINYGDGTVASLSAPSGTVSHAYAGAGAYAVLLAATDSNGQLGAASTVVQVGS